MTSIKTARAPPPQWWSVRWGRWDPSRAIRRRLEPHQRFPTPGRMCGGFARAVL